MKCKILLILFVGFLGFSSCLNTGKQCDKAYSCVCNYAIGMVIDLCREPGRNCTETTYTFVSNENIAYYYSPCWDKQLPYNQTSEVGALWVFNATNSTAKITEDEIKTGKINGTFQVIAKADESAFTATDLGANTAAILYGATAYVKLNCSPGANTSLSILPADSTYKHKLELSGDVACPYYGKPEDPAPSYHLSGFAVFVMVVCTVFLIYLIGGIVVNKYVKGAQGMEVIPNLCCCCISPSRLKELAVTQIARFANSNPSYQSI